MNDRLVPASLAGRFVTVQRSGAAYRAFVPHPLPPRVEFDHELVSVLSDADRALGELSGLGRMLPNSHLLIRPFIRREAVLSSRIEGTQANVAEVYAYEAVQRLVPGLGSSPVEADVREVANYVRALEYGLERLETLPLSQRFIRELHEQLLEGVRGEWATPGEFRRSQNWIGRPGCTLEEATYVPPPVAEMYEALDAFETYLHAEPEYPPLLRLAFLHYQFEAIHPFLDGNGRIGRLLISLLLVHWNLLSVPLLHLSAYFERHREDYLDLLLAVSERGAWRAWVRYFLRGVADEARDGVQRVKRLQDLQRAWRDRLMQGRASVVVLRLVDVLFESPVLTIPLVAQSLGVTYRAARLNVDKLVEVSILQPFGRLANTQWFVAGEVLRAIEAEHE